MMAVCKKIQSKAARLCLMASAFGVFAIVGSASLHAQSSDPSLAAANEIRFQQLEKEIRRLTGQIEEQNYEIRRLREELAKFTGDFDVRLRDLEGGRVASSSSLSAPLNVSSSDQEGDGSAAGAVKSQGSVSIEDDLDADVPSRDGGFSYTPPEEAHVLGTLKKSPQTGDVRPSGGAPQAYEYAYSFIKARDFSRAEREFLQFMTDYPNDPLVSNAKYWYGETFYVRGSYEKAARIFAEGYKQYPQGPKAASNLLKLGMALSGMGKAKDACIAYKQLKKEYAGSAVSLLKRADNEMRKIDCR